MAKTFYEEVDDIITNFAKQLNISKYEAGYDISRMAKAIADKEVDA